jgi:hypothetical protein
MARRRGIRSRSLSPRRRRRRGGDLMRRLADALAGLGRGTRRRQRRQSLVPQVPIPELPRVPIPEV